MVRFTDSDVAVDDYPPRQRDNRSRNGRWSPDYHYAGGAAPPSPGGAREGPYMTRPMLDPDPARPVLTRENSLQVPHWDRYRPRSVPPPMSPTTGATSMVFPPPRSRSRNHDRDREGSYHERDQDRRHQDRSSRPKTDRETKGRHRERYYDQGSSSSSEDERKSNKAAITRSRTPLSKARQAISSTFSDSTTGLGVGVIGAIVGGLAAREASENLLVKNGGHGRDGHGHHHSGKEALLSTIAGAAVGALGANVIEKRIEASKKKKTSSSSSATSPTSPSHVSGKGSDDGRNYTWGEERRRSSLTEEKRDRANGGRDRDKETYRDRDLRRDRSQGRGASKEEHRDRYYTSDDDDEVVYDHKRRSHRDRSRPPRRDDDDYRR